MYKDYVILSEESLLSDEDYERLPQTRIEVHGKDEKSLISLVRCFEEEEHLLLANFHDSQFIEILAEVVEDTYVFISPEKQVKYEELMEVGRYGVYDIALDESGAPLLDEHLNTIKISTKPYMFGLFA